ncbi:sensor histidine kinase [Kordiimonas lipolytica]|uniref:histidine kinase n=2 Tax=Kordiimonas lipolytica TaxID=1662421 RepID=A0ABV8UBP9_9PROT
MHSSTDKTAPPHAPMSSVLGQQIGPAGEEAWIEVVQKMDEVYSDLVNSQTELENKNEQLKKAYEELDDAHKKLTLAQERLIVSEKMAALGRLVAGVAHELNNPISFVFGNMHALKRYGSQISQFFELLRKKQPSPEVEDLIAEQKIDKILADITPLVEGTLEGAERVSDIVQGLRRFSSNQEEAPGQFNLVRVIRTAVDWVIKAERANPTVKLDLPEAMEITGRKGQTHQILVNLVQNAVDALSDTENPEIRVSCRSVDDAVEISIADNGPGIQAEEMDKIFEPFFTTKPVGQGTGLGLYISYGMALKQGGSLTATNNENGGATFTLKVPHDGQ